MKEQDTVLKALISIQKELKVPKSQPNEYGGFMYRSCEDILEAVKPLVHKHNCVVVMEDSIKEMGGRFYVEARVGLIHSETGKAHYTTALAREAQVKKGMDESQITGSASSYARKYALNGLFAIDDTKDADTQDNRSNVRTAAKTAPQKPVKDNFLPEYCPKCKGSISEAEIKFCKSTGKDVACRKCQ